jgi:beta-lactamase class A
LKFWLGLLGFGCFLVCAPAACPQEAVCSATQLQARLRADGALAQGRFGLAASLLETGRRTSVGGAAHYPMQSVYKLPIAMSVLDQVDRGRFRLSLKIRVEKKYYAPVQSPIRDKYPEGGVDLTLKELLAAAIVDSDGAASDILLARITPPGVAAFLQGIGLDDIKVVASEREMSQAWPVQYTNWATPEAIVKLLGMLQEKKVLSAASREMLLDWMTQSVPGPKRIKGMLPPNTPVAHKTGSSDTRGGLTAATNDVGLITLPDGRHIAIAVFISDSRADDATRDLAIATSARDILACWSPPH